MNSTSFKLCLKNIFFSQISLKDNFNQCKSKLNHFCIEKYNGGKTVGSTLSKDQISKFIDLIFEIAKCLNEDILSKLMN